MLLAQAIELKRCEARTVTMGDDPIGEEEERGKVALRDEQGSGRSIGGAVKPVCVLGGGL